MIELLPFTEKDFERLQGWISNEDELFQFAGPIFTFPLTKQQLKNYLEMPNKMPFKAVLSSSKETVGHCELNYENNKYKLSRILVGDSALRGQKIGEMMVRKMVELMFQDQHVNEVELNTFSWNKAALKCYSKVGFKINHELDEKIIVKNQLWTIVNLTLKRSQM